MSENLKIRFRLPNGEEFEAEGPQEFIDSERKRFLSLIGRNESTAATKADTPVPAIISQAQGRTTFTSDKAITQFTEVSAPIPGYSTTEKSTKSSISQNNLRRLWEQLLKEEGDTLILRRRSKLTASEAALLILAGAKNLLNKVDYRAILLSKSLKESGFETNRLDRLLADEIHSAHIIAQGSKRSRTYLLTPAGYAKAFVLAEKRVGDIL